MHRSRRTTTLTLTALATIALALTACAPQPGPAPEPSGSSRPNEGPSAAPEPTGQPSAGAPLTLRCSELVSDDAMYEYNPTYGLDDSWSPAAGSPAAIAVSLGGTACGWRTESSGELLVVAAARPSSAEVDDLRVAAKATGDRAFHMDGQVGIAESFERGYWVVTASEEFFELADAAPVLDPAVAALP